MIRRTLWCWSIILSMVLSPFQAWAGKGEVIYDVSGKAGEDDQDGQSYSGNAGRGSFGHGADGRDGGDAIENRNKHGQNAGNLFLNLSFSARGAVEVSGQKGGEVVRDAHPLTPDLKISAIAVGGKGGAGGNGGRGEDGGDGEDGERAYHIGRRPVPGTNGKNGGDGGNAGDPTSGGNAGRGGQITLNVSIQDTDLMMLVNRVDVSGNRGGQRGRSLGPGSAGSGGSGGASDYISWQEKVGEEPVYTSVEQKNSEGETIGYTQEQTGTRDIYQSYSSTAPGGSSGFSGSSGRDSSKSVQDGRDSQAGEYTYVVTDQNGNKQTYAGPYNLILQPGYSLKGDLNNNGFFEPGETVRVTGIKVTNNGLAPTPLHQKVMLYVTDNEGWIRSKQVELALPEVLNPGESHVFEKQHLAFMIAEKPRMDEGKLTGSDTLGPKARVTRVERDFRNFNDDSQTELKIRYPVEITPLTSLDTLAAGEVMKVLFKVKNVSEQTIGKIEGKDFRLAHAQIKRNGGSAEANEFVMLAKKGEQLADPATGLAKPLAGLKPGQEMIVEALVGLGSNPTPYTDVSLYPELYLQSVTKPGEVNRVQFNPFTLRVAQTFRHTENADVLLVANSGLNEKVLEAIRYSAHVKNLVMDIWDFSYYGFFNLHKSIAGWNSFFSAYRNKTIIILGNDVPTPNGKTRVQSLLNPDDIIEAGRRYGIRFVVIDTKGKAEEQVARMTAPESVSAESIGLDKYSSVGQYVKELQSEVHKFDEEIDGDQSHDLGYSEVQVTTHRLWGAPVEEKLVKVGNKLLKKARARAPEASLFIDYNFDAQRAGGWLIKKWNVGTLKVRRSVDLSRTSLLAMSVSESQMQKPEFIMSDEFQSALDIGLHLDTKLKLIAQILTGKFQKMEVPREFAHLTKRPPMEFAQILLRSVLLEIVQEQMTVRPFTFWSKVDKDTLWNKLDILSRVANYNYGQTELDPNSDAGKLWMDFIAELSYFSKHSVTLGQKSYSYTLGWVFGRSRNMQVTDVTNEMVNRLIKGVFADALVPDIELQLKGRVKEMNDKNGGQKGQAVAGTLSVADMLKGFFTNGNAVAERMRGAKEQKDLRAAATKRAGKNEAVREAYDKRSAELKLSPAECEAILAGRPATAKN